MAMCDKDITRKEYGRCGMLGIKNSVYQALNFPCGKEPGDEANMYIHTTRHTQLASGSCTCSTSILKYNVRSIT